MAKRSSIFDFFTQVFVVFGFSMICVSVFCLLFGEDGREVSTMFALGNAGVPIYTVGQYFIVAILVTSFRELFFTDKIIKNWSIAARTISMMACDIIMVAVFAKVFGWFPVDMAEAWIGFLVSFIICTACGVGISIIKEKSENKKLQDALDKFNKGAE